PPLAGGDDRALGPGVLRPAFLRVVRRDRLGLAAAHRTDAERRYAEGDQVAPRRLRAPLGERLVVLVGADRIRVADEEDLRAVVLHQAPGEVREALAGRGLELRLVEVE